MSLAPGDRLGVYEVVGLLGTGGMGDVYRAVDTRLDRQVAIKVLPETVRADPERVARFEREAKLLASLNHSNIAGIYGLEEANSEQFIVMELVEGATLADRIAEGPIPVPEALQIAKQIADALEAAHEAGVIHRDVKPPNIKVRPDGTVKVLDFGLAKALAGDPLTSPTTLTNSPTITSPVGVTGIGTLLGTAAYMSPEQAVGKSADRRSDIWAFGVVLLEMLTGRQVFEGETVSHVLAAVLKEEPAWARVPATTPPAIRRLLRRCLEKDRKQRLDSASAARLEIVEALTSPPLIAASRREPLAWLLASTAVIVAVGSLAGLLWTGRRLPPTPNLRPVRFDVITPSSDPSSIALSPDGELLAFVAAVDGAARLWIRPLAETTAHPLTGTDGASYPFWSPDARSIGFFAEGKLKRIDVAGGTAQVLARAPSGRGGAWNRDGIILFTPSASARDPMTVLTRVSASGGTPVPVTHLSAGHGSHRWPQFLPDGRRFVFISALGRPDTNGVYLGFLDGREPIRVLAAESSALFHPPNTLLVVRQGVLHAVQFDPDSGSTAGEEVRIAEDVGTDGTIARSAFTISETGVLAYRTQAGQRRQLAWFDRAGKRLASIGMPDDNSMSAPSLDSPGRRVAVVRGASGNLDVWVMDVNRGSATRLTFDPGLDSEPVWSADSQRIVFRSNRNGTSDLFEKPASGGEERLLLHDAGTPLSASPDGHFLLYTRASPKTGGDIWALPLTGDPTPFPVVETTADEFACQFSPDGRWIAYESNESDRSQIWVRPFPVSGSRWQISTGGGTQPQWSQNGKEIYYLAPDMSLMAAPLTIGADGHTLDAGAPVPLFATRLASGSNVLPSQSQYAVAPDGRFLMNVRADDASLPVSVVLHWTTMLKP